MSKNELERTRKNEENYRKTKSQYDKFVQKWRENNSLTMNVTSQPSVKSTINALEFWYFYKLLGKISTIRNLRGDVNALRSNKLITPTKENEFIEIIQNSEIQLWSAIIDIVENDKYKSLDGKEVYIKTIDNATDALHIADSIINRLQQHLQAAVQQMKTDKKYRDNACTEEYEKTIYCEPSACKLQHSFFGGSATCKSKN